MKPQARVWRDCVSHLPVDNGVRLARTLLSSISG